jgi:hypothetical protein
MNFEPKVGHCIAANVNINVNNLRRYEKDEVALKRAVMPVKYVQTGLIALLIYVGSI